MRFGFQLDTDPDGDKERARFWLWVAFWVVVLVAELVVGGVLFALVTGEGFSPR